MNITSAQHLETVDLDGTATNTAIKATIDGTEMFVPMDTANRHYQSILDWVAEGNTITPAS